MQKILNICFALVFFSQIFLFIYSAIFVGTYLPILSLFFHFFFSCHCFCSVIFSALMKPFWLVIFSSLSHINLFYSVFLFSFFCSSFSFLGLFILFLRRYAWIFHLSFLLSYFRFLLFFFSLAHFLCLMPLSLELFIF